MERTKKAVTDILVNSMGKKGISFRPLTVEDAEDVFGIFSPEEVYAMVHWRPNSMEETHNLVRTWLSEKTDAHLMIERGGETCGIFRLNAFAPGKRDIWLSLIIVKPEMQNSGLGTAALKQAVKALKASGMFDTMMLGVDADDGAAVKCFERAGFQITERTTQKYSNVPVPVERYIMTLKLA